MSDPTAAAPAPDLSGSAVSVHAPETKGVSVTPAVFARLRVIAAETPQEGRWLRVAVLGGGCSGFQYEFKLEQAPAEDDAVYAEGPSEADRVGVLIDPVSAPFLESSVIDFKRELIGARFAVENPNAASSCGCGVSFSM